MFIVVSFALIIGGPQVADWLANQYALGAAFAWTWKVLQWPIAFALVVTGISLVYATSRRDADQGVVVDRARFTSCGDAVGVGIAGIPFYVVNFGGYETTYGGRRRASAASLWFYLSGFVIGF